MNANATPIPPNANQEPVILQRDKLQAGRIARRLAETLAQRGLAPAFQEHLLTTISGVLMLVSELDVRRMERMEQYRSEELLHQMSANLQGMKVYLSNTTGLRYVVPLTKSRGLPKRIDVPPDSVARGKIALGLNYQQKQVQVEWGDLGHMLVAGMTGSGKSMFLRLVVYQAIHDGMKLLLADIDQATFPMLANHPALYAPLAVNTDQALDLIRQALVECDRRAALFQSMPGYPEHLDEYNKLAVKIGREPLPRLLLALDEFSATLSALGGGRGDAGKMLAALGFRGRKFGVSVIFAAHEFTKEQVGLMRDQVRTVIMLRVHSKEMAKRMGCPGAETIPASRPGLAVTNRWGPMQTYFLDKSALIPGGGSVASGRSLDNGLALSPVEMSVFQKALANADGALTRNHVMR